MNQGAVIPRFTSICLGAAAALGALLLMKHFSGIIGPMFLAVNLMVTAYPIHTWLVRKGTPSWLSAVVLSLAVFTTLVVMLAGLVWSVNEMVNLLPDYASEFTTIYNQGLVLAGRFGIDSAAVTSVWRMIDPNSIITAAGSFVSGASGIVTVFVTIIAALVFITMDTPGFEGRLSMLTDSRQRVATALSGFAQGIRRYWLVTTIFGIIVAVLDGIALAIMGVPLALVWALFSFLTNYIPNIGFVIGLMPPALIALFAKGWQTAVLVIVIYSVLNFVVQSIIQPRFTGQSVGVTPTVSFVSLLVWTLVIGGMGTLLALPMTLFFKAILIDADPNTRWINTLIASDPGDADPIE